MNVQADLNLRWVHISEGTFSDIPALLFEVGLVISLSAFILISDNAPYELTSQPANRR